MTDRYELEQRQSQQRFINFIRACIGKQPIPHTAIGFPEGAKWLEVLGLAGTKYAYPRLMFVIEYRTQHRGVWSPWRRRPNMDPVPKRHAQTLVDMLRRLNDGVEYRFLLAPEETKDAAAE